MTYGVVISHFNKTLQYIVGGLSLTRHVKQQLEIRLLTSVRCSEVANWTSLSMVRNNVKRKSWGKETICTKVLYSNGKEADPGLIYAHRNEDCPGRLYVLLCALPILFTCIIYDHTTVDKDIFACAVLLITHAFE